MSILTIHCRIIAIRLLQVHYWIVGVNTFQIAIEAQTSGSNSLFIVTGMTGGQVHTASSVRVSASVGRSSLFRLVVVSVRRFDHVTAVVRGPTGCAGRQVPKIAAVVAAARLARGP